MIMSRKERSCANLPRVLNVFGDRPRNTEAIIGASPSADFIKEDQAPSGGVIQNMRSFDHLDHKRALPSREVVGGPNAGKNPIDQADPCLCGWDEAAHLR